MSSLAAPPREFVSPAQKMAKGMAVGVPSLGVVPVEFALSLPQQHMPINFGMIYCSPTDVRWDWEKNETVQAPGQRCLPVADSRNVIAEFCVKNNIEWLFFRDDDTIAPPDSINKLFTLYRDCLDKQMPVACIGGNYMSKQIPPHSLILVDGHLAGYENWTPGQIVGGEKTAIGMGCTLIHVDVLRKIPPPWFKTVDTLDPDAKVFNPLANGIVKTGNDIQDVAPGCVRMTEDVYFCRKAAKYGFTQVWCDTSIQCEHIDITSRRKYFYHAGLRRGVWQDGPVVQWYMRPGEIFDRSKPMGGLVPGTNGHDANGAATPAVVEPPKPEIVRFDLGTPGHKEGYITVDLYEMSADEHFDIHSLAPLVAKYGKADEIRAHHILEHFPFRECVPLLAEWLSALKPGGVLDLEVPDAEWGCENLLKHKDVDLGKYWDEAYKLIGFQSNQGDFHRNVFTLGAVRQLVSDPVFNLEVESCEHFSYPDPKVQRAIRATARKKKEPERVGNPTELVLADAGA